jgi:hypothetical protein
MSDLFNSVKVGDTVHYSTPQGQYGKGKVVIHGGTHVVINRGKGQPQVVNDNNYVKHERGGKVVGALLSKVAAHDKYLKGVASTKASNAVAKAVSPYKKVGDPQMNAAKAFGWVKEDHDSIEAVKNATTRRIANSHLDLLAKHGPQKVMDAIDAVAEFHGAGGLEEIGSSDVSAFVNHVKRHLGEEVVDEATWQGAGDPYNWDPVMRAQVFAAVAKKVKKLPGAPQPNKLDTGRAYKPTYSPPPRRGTANEDSKDVGGEAERVAKTKKHKKKLHELDSSTLASYVSKAITDRKKAASGKEMAHRIHTPERAKYFADKADKRIAKRAAGIKTAVAKIATHLPGEPLKAHSDSEGAKHGGWHPHVLESAAPGKEAWIKANKARFIERYGKEKGLRVLYAKAWKDSKNESVVNEQGERAGKARAGEHEWVRDLADRSPQMSQSAGKKAPGHYLMKGGRTISGPHEPHEAVRAYKNLPDSKGVKIVHHTNEGTEIDVTALMLSEDKVKKAAEKAISLAKKAKGNKHVDTQPTLDVADKGTHGPIEGSEQGERNDRLS